jgi:tetratricopeptide (TPR) repeat protein
MPKTSTDIPHIAFTHHRIAIPADAGSDLPVTKEVFAQLIPMSDISHLPPWEQQRCLALAYLEFSEGKPDAAWSRYRAQSLHLLEAVRSQGLDDLEVNAALARLYWEQGRLTEAVSLAESVIRTRSNSGSVTNALLVLGDSYRQLNQPLLARDALVRLVALRRQSEYWMMLANCLRGLGEVEVRDAIQACQNAIEIQPERGDAHLMLAELYATIGNAQAAAQHRGIMEKLDRLAPRP